MTVAPASTAHTHLLPCQPKSVRDGICVDPPLCRGTSHGKIDRVPKVLCVMVRLSEK